MFRENFTFFCNIFVVKIVLIFLYLINVFILLRENIRKI